MSEMAECLEIFFAMKGTISAGFEINKIRQIGIQWECDQDKGACVVGGYNCTFFQRSNYIWKCQTDVEGYFIYRCDWVSILEDHDEIGRILK